MSDRSFKIYDTALIVSAPGMKPDRVRGVAMTWKAPDYETFNRLLRVLESKGFIVTRDPGIEQYYPSLGRHHRVGSRPTPSGDLWFHAETYATGCKVEFYQDVVTVNQNGGRYDFDRRDKMPYLIGRAYEAAMRAACAHLLDRGFADVTQAISPVADPLGYFNQRWDSEWDRAAGRHRFKRGEDGWPIASELNSNQVSDTNPLPAQGSVWYYRDRGGRLARGRVYGGINGMWTVVYGPRPNDFTHKARFELFQCHPAAEPRRVVPAKRGIDRLTRELRAAVETENFERAIVLRDSLRKAA